MIALFRKVAEEIIRDERAKNHRLLADDLEKILLNGNGVQFDSRVEKFIDIPKDREKGFPLISISEQTYTWDRLILPSKTFSVLQKICEENRKRDLLTNYDILPRQKLLFFGPPGTGKTLAAKVIVSELQLPLITVRFDAIVSSYLGETATNLRRVFEFIERGQWIVLFDEFDAIGKDRDNPFEHGELKRVVNTMLQLMDAFKGESIIIAATNHETLLDSAIWRRFESVIHFGLPTEQDRILQLRLFLKGFHHDGVELDLIGKKTKNATGSDLEQIALDAVRESLMDQRNNITEDDLFVGLEAFRERTSMIRNLSTKDFLQSKTSD